VERSDTHAVGVLESMGIAALHAILPLALSFRSNGYRSSAKGQGQM